MLDMMEEEGYNLVRLKNTFKNGSPYKGVNIILKDSNENSFELQFHTDRSFKIKETELHEIYEKYRIETNLNEKNELYNRMIEVSNKINIPPQIERIMDVK